jgi:hypothetical protein
MKLKLVPTKLHHDMDYVNKVIAGIRRLIPLETPTQILVTNASQAI